MSKADYQRWATADDCTWVAKMAAMAVLDMGEARAMRVDDGTVARIADDAGPRVEGMMARDLRDCRAWIELALAALAGVDCPSLKEQGMQLLDNLPPRATDEELQIMLDGVDQPGFAPSRDLLQALFLEVQGVRAFVRARFRTDSFGKRYMVPTCSVKELCRAIRWQEGSEDE